LRRQLRIGSAPHIALAVPVVRIKTLLLLQHPNGFGWRTAVST
jgi:hypothetical protein